MLEAKVLMQQVSLDMAESVIEKAQKKANELGVAFSFSVVDNGGHLLVFKHMPNAILASIEISMRKARTAALVGIGTDALGEIAKKNGGLYGVEQTNGGLVAIPSGLPIKNDQDELVGAIGVSGGADEQDLEVARAALRQ